MKLRIGLSPCPNDTFIFDALLNGKLDTHGIEFEPVFADVEELNHMAQNGQLEVTKISVGAYPFLAANYVILDAGAALGNGVGPLLVASRQNIDLNDTSIKIAIPGEMTTANLLLSLFKPHLQNKKSILFSSIEDAILEDEMDAGVLIHEGRFTYQQKGLHLLFDLGAAWENTYQVPLPLGCICASRNLNPETILKVEKLISESVRFAFSNPTASQSFVQAHAQEMDPLVIQQHIQLYVNDYSVALGKNGKEAISRMLELVCRLRNIPTTGSSVFTQQVA